MVVDHNAKEIRIFVSQTADHATNAGGTKGTASLIMILSRLLRVKPRPFWEAWKVVVVA